MSLFELNPQMWMHVAKHLEPEDLMALRLVDKTLFKMLGEDYLWRDKCEQKWNPFEVNEPIPYCEGYFDYFVTRTDKDQRIRRVVTEINNSGEPGLVLSKSRSLVSERYCHILVKLTGVENLGERYIANGILRAIRTKHALQYVSNPSNFMKTDIESFFFNLSALDCAFDLLVPYRDAFYAKVKQRTLAYPCLIDPNVNNTTKILILIEIYQQVHIPKTDFRSNKNFRNDIMPSTEDYSLLRVYANEVIGIPEIRHSIIQKMGSLFDIPVRVCNSFIVVLDLTQPEGFSCFSVENTTEVYSVAMIISRLEAIGAPFDLDKILDDFQFEQFLNPYWTIEDGSIYYHFPPDTKTYQDIFIHSKRKMDTDWLNVLYITHELHALEPAVSTTMSKVVELFQNDDPFLILAFEENIIKLLETAQDTPQDSEEVWNAFITNFKDFYYDYPSSETRYNFLDPMLKLGQVVFRPSTNSFNVVLRHDSNERYKLLLLNELSLQQSHTRHLYIPEDQLEVVLCTTPEIVEFLVCDLSIGRYFEGFDQESRCFVPKKWIKERTIEGFLP